MTTSFPLRLAGAYNLSSHAYVPEIVETEPPDVCRYHLYVGNACPWCHRVLLALAILGLNPFITFTWLLDDAERASRGGWVFDAATGVDPVFGAADLRYAA